MIDVVGVLQGTVLQLVNANESLMERRLRLCKTCPNYNRGGTCSLCGCELMKKARIGRMHCPKKNNPLW
jgi:hypothetical protein